MSLDLTPEYAKSLGRIGGQLLSDNLLFQGQDVQFDTDLLYLDVTNKRIGINNFGTSPATLYLGGDKYLQSINLIVDGVTSTDFGWTISTNNIQRPGTGTIFITPVQTSPVITASGVGVRDINVIAPGEFITNADDLNIQILTNGTGVPIINGNLTVNGANKLIQITGSVTVDGNYIAGSVINLGDQTTDTINFSAEQAADLVPDLDDTYNLGSPQSKWNIVRGQTLNSVTTASTTSSLGGILFRGSTIGSVNIAQDITIVTPTVSTISLFDNLLDGGDSFGAAPDLLEGGDAFGAAPDLLDGGDAFSVLASNAGNILFNGLPPFTGSNINNNTFDVYNAPYYLLSTNDGYINFGGTNGVVFPIGDTSERNTEILGTTRYNTDLGILEVFNGTDWQNSIGSSPITTQEFMDDASVIYDLMLG